MSLGRHSTVTSAQREELWRRYKAGETVLGIGRALSQRTTNLYRVLQAAGGIAPPQRTRSPRVLSFPLPRLMEVGSRIHGPLPVPLLGAHLLRCRWRWPSRSEGMMLVRAMSSKIGRAHV